jgi:hypothetical protein
MCFISPLTMQEPLQSLTAIPIAIGRQGADHAGTLPFLPVFLKTRFKILSYFRYLKNNILFLWAKYS